MSTDCPGFLVWCLTINAILLSYANKLPLFLSKKKKVVFPSPYPSVSRLALLGEWTQVLAQYHASLFSSWWATAAEGQMASRLLSGPSLQSAKEQALLPSQPQTWPCNTCPSPSRQALLSCPAEQVSSRPSHPVHWAHSSYQEPHSQRVQFLTICSWSVHSLMGWVLGGETSGEPCSLSPQCNSGGVRGQC